MTNHGKLIWNGDRYERVDDRPEPVELTVAERERILDQCQAEVEQAALERGATAEEAREGARRLRGQFRVKAGPVGLAVEAYAEGGWGILLNAEDAARRMGHEIVKEARKVEEEAAPPPTAAELAERMRRENNAHHYL